MSANFVGDSCPRAQVDGTIPLLERERVSLNGPRRNGAVGASTYDPRLRVRDSTREMSFDDDARGVPRPKWIFAQTRTVSPKDLERKKFTLTVLAELTRSQFSAH
jgi:hypothetical protein